MKDIKPYFVSNKSKAQLYHGDCVSVIPLIDRKYDMVFADPPYFLSNNGLTIKNGLVTSVNKASWDSIKKIKSINDFNTKWLTVVRDKMNEDATIWISGTMHNIFSIGVTLKELNFKVLNIITWQKPNPPPNFSKRFFTHSTEYIIWARKNEKTPHRFNYELMKKQNNGKQMKDVWLMNTVSKEEKRFGKHPVQKPLGLLERIILASTKRNAIILDPFTGSSTTGVAALKHGRKFVGVDNKKSYLNLSIKRIANYDRL